MILTLAITLFWTVETHLKPTVLAIAEAKAVQVATQTINNVINEKVSQHIDPQALVNVKLDSRGRVVFIQPNTLEFNRLAADTTIKVQDALKQITTEKVYIPVGQVFGSQLLASLGPP
jgi:sporulation protein YunB